MDEPSTSDGAGAGAGQEPAPAPPTGSAATEGGRWSAGTGTGTGAGAPRSPAARFLRGCTILALLLAIVAGVLAAVVYERSERKVKSTARDWKVTATPELLARGRYLSQVSCEPCHGKDSAGGREFALPIVRSWASNITQDQATGIGAWSDGQIEEAIRRGVRCDEPATTRAPGKREKDCRVLRPPMPVFAHLSDDDVTALVAHLRTVPAVSKAVPVPALTVLGRVVFALAKKPAHAVPVGIAAPPPDRLGEYLANELCRCADCHHPRVRNEPITGRLWSGGMRWEEPGQPPVLSSNLTPDVVEGIGAWTKEQLVRALREGTNAAGRRLHDAMPRYPLTDADAGAIFDYLRAQPPVRSHVWSPGALRGSDLYARSGCASCHGFDGKGPRADITKTGASGDVAKIKAWIKDPVAAKPDTQMPRMGIEDDADLEALARFVVELSQHQP